MVISALRHVMTNDLESLLKTNETGHTKWFELTDKNVYSATSANVALILDRLTTIRRLSLQTINFSFVPNQFFKYFAQRGIHLSAKQLRDHSPSSRIAMMTATLKELEAELTDIAVQMNDEILAGVFSRSKGRAENYLRKHQKTIRKVVTVFKFMSDVLIAMKNIIYMARSHLSRFQQ